MEYPLCNLRDSSDNPRDKYDFIAAKASTQAAFEEPSAGIHFGAVHQAYVSAAELYAC